MKAYIEISVEPKEIEYVLRMLRRIENVREVACVTGHCDIVATTLVPDMERLSKLLIEKIDKLRGVTRTQTLVCMER